MGRRTAHGVGARAVEDRLRDALADQQHVRRAEQPRLAQGESRRDWRWPARSPPARRVARCRSASQSSTASALPSRSGSSTPPADSAASSAWRLSPALGQRARSFRAPRGAHRRGRRARPAAALRAAAGYACARPAEAPPGADRDQHRIAVEHAGRGEIAQVRPIDDVDQQPAQFEALGRVFVALAFERDEGDLAPRRQPSSIVSTTSPPARSTSRRLASAAGPSPSTITGVPAMRWKSGRDRISPAASPAPARRR